MGDIGETNALINATCMLKGTQCRGENGAYALTQVAFDHDCYRCPNSARTHAGPDLVFFLPPTGTTCIHGGHHTDCNLHCVLVIDIDMEPEASI